METARAYNANSPHNHGVASTCQRHEPSLNLTFHLIDSSLSFLADSHHFIPSLHFLFTFIAITSREQIKLRGAIFQKENVIPSQDQAKHPWGCLENRPGQTLLGYPARLPDPLTPSCASPVGARQLKAPMLTCGQGLAAEAKVTISGGGSPPVVTVAWLGPAGLAELLSPLPPPRCQRSWSCSWSGSWSWSWSCSCGERKGGFLWT